MSVVYAEGSQVKEYGAGAQRRTAQGIEHRVNDTKLKSVRFKDSDSSLTPDP